MLKKKKRGGDGYGVFLILLCVACFQDMRTGKISNILIVSAFAVSVFYLYFASGYIGVAEGILKAVIYLMVLYPLFKTGVLGAGDIKLLAMTEMTFEWKEGGLYFVLVWIVAGFFALGKMLAEGNFVERMEYFFSYAADLFTTGTWKYYHKERETGGRADRAIHMSLPIMLAFVLRIGG